MRHNKFSTLTVLLLAAFMLRALIPSGWMPQSSSTGDGLTLVICTAAGLQQIALGPDGEPVDDQSSNAGHEPCPFAAGAKFPPPLMTATPAPHLAVARPEFVSQTSVTLAATHLRLAVPRAPPVLG